MSAPLPEAPCANCGLTRPLFVYEPDHGFHLGTGQFTCRWCTRDSQPKLCVRCWDAEKELEENDPALDAEASALEQICATNRRILESEASKENVA